MQIARKDTGLGAFAYTGCTGGPARKEIFPASPDYGLATYSDGGIYGCQARGPHGQRVAERPSRRVPFFGASRGYGADRCRAFPLNFTRLGH